MKICMKSEKELLKGELCHVMEQPDKPYEHSRREEDSLEYKTFLERGRIGNADFDAYLQNLSSEMQTYDGINPYERNALKPLTDKADAFLRKYAGISYEEFLRQSRPEEFTENDFGKLPLKKNLRRRLFEHRALLYLSALEDCDRQGHNVDSVLAEIKNRTIPYLKRELEEPTFREILKALGKSN